MKANITVPAGDVVGIGKLKVFSTQDFQHEIPTLSFLVAQTPTKDFHAQCIQLCMDGNGITPNAAIDAMCNNCISYLHMIFENEKMKGKEWNMLHELFTMENDDLWTAYHDVQLNLAEQGRSVDFKEALCKRIGDLEKQIADLRALMESKQRFDIKVVDYEEQAA